MSFINLEQLPFAGMSYEFHGEKHGAPLSAYIVNAKSGQGPPLHTHPYVEIAFTLEGCAAITVRNETHEVKAGSIVVIPANTPHRFVNSATPFSVRSTSTRVLDSSRRISREELHW